MDSISRQTTSCLQGVFTDVFSLEKSRKNEVVAALASDAAMAEMIQRPEGLKFIDDLVNALNQKTEFMTATDHGMAITLRFPECYGSTAHIALAGAWRDETGQIGRAHV